MPIGDSITVRQEKNCEDVFRVLTAFADTFPETLADEEKRKAYAEKITSHGFFLTAYWKQQPVGMICGYANDFDTKTAYISYFVIKEDIGLMRGVVFMKGKEALVMYLRKQGMEHLRIQVYNDNTHALKLYSQIGFSLEKDVNARSNYYLIEIDKI